jgi:hypothetical protein
MPQNKQTWADRQQEMCEVCHIEGLADAVTDLLLFLRPFASLANSQHLAAKRIGESAVIQSAWAGHHTLCQYRKPSMKLSHSNAVNRTGRYNCTLPLSTMILMTVYTPNSSLQSSLDLPRCFQPPPSSHTQRSVEATPLVAPNLEPRPPFEPNFSCRN